MSEETTRSRLTRGVKAALLDTMRKAPVVERSAGAAPPSRAGRRDMSFASLPAYQQLSTQRGLADALGVNFPFYRNHDVRAGARSVIDGNGVVNFASYDYLGLNGHPEITRSRRRRHGAMGHQRFRQPDHGRRTRLPP